MFGSSVTMLGKWHMLRGLISENNDVHIFITQCELFHKERSQVSVKPIGNMSYKYKTDL